MGKFTKAGLENFNMEIGLILFAVVLSAVVVVYFVFCHKLTPTSMAERPVQTDVRPFVSSDQQMSQPAPKSAPVPQGEKPTILVAEDNPSNYKLVEVLLRNDYTLLHAENGQVAVDLFREHRPPIVLMDINMPVMDGYDALRGIRAIDPLARVIALTAYAFETDRLKMLQAGFNDCMSKPIDINELRSLVAKELGRS